MQILPKKQNLPKKSKKLQKMIDLHHEVRNKVRLLEAEKKIKKLQQELETATPNQMGHQYIARAQISPHQTAGKLAILINLVQKQVEDLKAIVFALEEDIREIQEKLGIRDEEND